MTKTISLTPGKRVLFLTKDPELIRRQLSGELDLTMDQVSVEDLLDDINTDTMTPAWVCFDYKPELIAINAYAGLIVDGKRVIGERELMDGGFEVIVSGLRKGVGSSRETAVQAEKWCGIRIAVASSFSPIHARNNINQGVLMAGHDVLAKLQAGEKVSIDSFTKDYDPITKLIVEHGGLFPFARALKEEKVLLPKRDTGKRAMTMGEKILAAHLVPNSGPSCVKPGDAVLVEVDGGYSHEFTTAQVHHFLAETYGDDYTVRNAEKFAVFEDHLIYADGVENMMPFSDKIETLRVMQREFQEHTGVRDFSAKNNVSPGICHQVAREKIIEPAEFIQATDSHTCMGGGSNALAWGVGATEYANLIHSGFTLVTVPESIRFNLTGTLNDGCTAKDIMLYILANHARREETLNRIMEFGGDGITRLSMDERATLANMATECGAATGIVEADEQTDSWISSMRPGSRAESFREKHVLPDPGAEYFATHSIDLSTIVPMVANPGNPDKGIASDPKNGQRVDEIGKVKIDIAYGGSCTAGKRDDLDFYARVIRDAVEHGRRVAAGVTFYIQFGSEDVATYAKEQGYLEIFEKAGVRIIAPGCGACIGCGPGVSESSDQVTVSAINRNYKGRSGPGMLWLASPLTVAASAIEGHIVAYSEGAWSK